MLQPLRRYAEFHGRASRLEYWSFSFFILGSVVATGLLIGTIGNVLGLSVAEGSAINGVGTGVIGLFLLGTRVPSLAVTVRRLHDQGRSGGFLLLMLIPGVGAFILMVLMLLPGESAGNRYGPPPAARTAS